MTTNAYLLNRELFLRFLKVGVRSFQITMDGFEYNTRRMLASGEGTYDIILDNLQKIKELDHNIDFTIILRRNILKDDLDFTWYDFLKTKFNDDQRFVFSVIPVEKQGGKNNENLNTINGESDLVYQHLDYMKKIGLNIMLQAEPNPLSAVCYAAYPHGYLFQVNGDICKCTIELNNPLNYVGKINHGSVELNLQAMEKWSKNYFDTQCYSCKNALLCLNRPVQWHIYQENSTFVFREISVKINFHTPICVRAA